MGGDSCFHEPLLPTSRVHVPSALVCVFIILITTLPPWFVSSRTIYLVGSFAEVQFDGQLNKSSFLAPLTACQDALLFGESKAHYSGLPGWFFNFFPQWFWVRKLHFILPCTASTALNFKKGFIYEVIVSRRRPHCYRDQALTHFKQWNKALI
jgi:hypothetical protein